MSNEKLSLDEMLRIADKIEYWHSNKESYYGRYNEVKVHLSMKFDSGFCIPSTPYYSIEARGADNVLLSSAQSFSREDFNKMQRLYARAGEDYERHAKKWLGDVLERIRDMVG